jgi:hypothetical protein
MPPGGISLFKNRKASSGDGGAKQNDPGFSGGAPVNSDMSNPAATAAAAVLARDENPEDDMYENVGMFGSTGFSPGREMVDEFSNMEEEEYDAPTEFETEATIAGAGDGGNKTADASLLTTAGGPFTADMFDEPLDVAENGDANMNAAAFNVGTQGTTSGDEIPGAEEATTTPHQAAGGFGRFSASNRCGTTQGGAPSKAAPTPATAKAPVESTKARPGLNLGRPSRTTTASTNATTAPRTTTTTANQPAIVTRTPPVTPGAAFAPRPSGGAAAAPGFAGRGSSLAKHHAFQFDQSIVTPESTRTASPTTVSAPPPPVADKNAQQLAAAAAVAAAAMQQQRGTGQPSNKDGDTAVEETPVLGEEEEHLDEEAFEEILSHFLGDLRDSTDSLESSNVTLLDREVDLSYAFSQGLAYCGESMDIIDDLEDMDLLADEILFEYSNM